MAAKPPHLLPRLLDPSRALPVALAAALLLTASSARLGLFADDIIQTLYIEGRFPLNPARFDLYDFATGTPASYRESMARGMLPWWAQPELKLHFLRPLSSALRLLDHQLFAASPLGYHLHSIAWYLALVAAAGLFFRSALPGATGALALLLFAVHGTHAMPADWIACRHVLVAAAPSVLGLAAHLRYRERGFRPGRWLALVGLAVGLLGGETALGAIGYLLAYELLAAREGGEIGWRARLAGALPALGLSAVYLAVYKALGYGAAGNDMYIEPLSSPRDFAIALLSRIPILLGNLLAGITSDLSNLLPRGPFVASGLIASAAAALLLRAALPAVPEADRRALRWLVPGALLALLASAGGLPGARLLMMPSLGASALVATLLRFGLRAAAARASATGRLCCRLGWGAFALVHVLVAPIQLGAGPLFLDKLSSRMAEIARTAEIPSLPEQQVVILSADPLAAVYPGAIRLSETPDTLAGWQLLSLARYPHLMTRTGPTSFRLEVVGGRFLDSAFEQLYRSWRKPFHAGDTMTIDQAKVVVTGTDGGKPSAIEVDFTMPLEDPRLCLLAWRDGRLRRVVPPPVGASLEIPWEPGPADGR